MNSWTVKLHVIETYVSPLIQYNSHYDLFYMKNQTLLFNVLKTFHTDLNNKNKFKETD
jgi:hypothetical protein